MLTVYKNPLFVVSNIHGNDEKEDFGSRFHTSDLKPAIVLASVYSGSSIHCLIERDPPLFALSNVA